MRGRPRKPAGTAHRKGHDAPGLGIVDRHAGGFVIPAPPLGLLKVSRERWESYWRSAVSAAVDIGADWGRLERWIRAVDEWHRVGVQFRKNRVVDGSQGQPVLNPLGTYLQQIEQVIARSEVELGMTPMARLKLGIAMGQVKLTVADLNNALNADDAVTPVGDGETDEQAIEAAWEEV